MSSSNIYTIAEIGNNHQGDVKHALKLIKAAKECGADAVKTQKRDNIKRSKVSDPSGKSIMSYKAYHFEDKSAATDSKVDLISSVSFPAAKSSKTF